MKYFSWITEYDISNMDRLIITEENDDDLVLYLETLIWLSS